MNSERQRTIETIQRMLARALATHPASRGLDLDVKAAAGLVTIGGEVPQPQWTTHTSSRWETELTEIAKTAEGVTRILLEIRPFDAYH